MNLDDVSTPDLKERMQALILDVIILFALMFIMYKVFDAVGDVSDLVRMWGFIFIWYIYDPLLTSLLGGTLGHLAMGLRVRRIKDPNRRINILVAYVRYTVKALFGLISLIMIAASRHGQGLHDLIANSIVISKKSEKIQLSNDELIDTADDDQMDLDDHLVDQE